MSRTHGHASYVKGVTRTYKSWLEMHARCERKNHISFSNYGGRGIKVCARWKRFENFLADMGERPEGTTLDRKNNNGNYTPKNCRWATRKEQNNKRRQCHYIRYKGKSRTIAQWCEELRLPYSRTYHRLIVQGLSPKQSFSRSLQSHEERRWRVRHLSGKSVRTLAEERGLKYKTVQQRMYRDGMTLDEALSKS